MGKVRGETAGALAELLIAFMEGGITYPGREEHAKQVIGYLGCPTWCFAFPSIAHGPISLEFSTVLGATDLHQMISGSMQKFGFEIYQTNRTILSRRF